MAISVTIPSVPRVYGVVARVLPVLPVIAMRCATASDSPAPSQKPDKALHALQLRSRNGYALEVSPPRARLPTLARRGQRIVSLHVQVKTAIVWLRVIIVRNWMILVRA